jgi:hypothetical protein
VDRSGGPACILYAVPRRHRPQPRAVIRRCNPPGRHINPLVKGPDGQVRTQAAGERNGSDTALQVGGGKMNPTILGISASIYGMGAGCAMFLELPIASAALFTIFSILICMAFAVQFKKEEK